MQFHAPHPSAAFEGYYSKFDLPSGAHLALVLCRVKDAPRKPNMLSFTYIPSDASPTYQKEFWPEHMTMTTLASQGYAFEINIPDVGFVKWNDDGSSEYRLKTESFGFKARTTSRTAWSSSTDTPEGLLVHLPLPLHWHVHSLASDCRFQLDMPVAFPTVDRSGMAVVHQEKNWAHSFPAAHMWLQARDGHRGFCCAGGKILGMEAFLLGYRSENYNIDFRPPFALRFAGLSPFMSYTSDWAERTFSLSIQGLKQKLTVTAEAPIGTFFSLSSPFPDGHRENFLGQSFRASIKIQVFESAWLIGPWELVYEDSFDKASLEFGGEYYPPAGTDQRFH